MAPSRYLPFLLHLVLFTSLILAPAYLWGQEVEEIDWKYEIDLLGKELAEKHPDLFLKTDADVFYSEFAQIASAAPELSLFQVSIRLQQVIARMGDAHTGINYHFNIDSGFILPIKCYWFDDGIYILETPVEFEQILGKKLVAINATPIEEVIDSLATLIVDDNHSLVKYHVPRIVIWAQLLEYFGFADHQELTLTVADQQGNLQKQPISLPMADGNVVTLQTKSIPVGWQEPKAYFRHRYFPENKLYYIQYNRCWSREVEEEFGSGASALFIPSFKEFEKEVFKELKKVQVDRLVFDMRFNSGGNAAQGTKFIQKLCKTKLKGEGKYYVVVGRKTFSSAIINTVDFIKSTEVVLVGEETGGRPNHFGEVKRFVLPESRLIVNHSTKYFTLLKEDMPTITPDLMAPMTFDLYLKGIDPALEAIKKHSSK